jgi:hypothetical protein
MKEHIERIDRYLKGIDLPEHTSDQHRCALRRQILSEIERKQTMSVRSRTWKVTIAVAALIGGAAIATAVGVKVYRYHFEGRGATGAYHFATEPQTVYHQDYTDANGNQRNVTVMTSRAASMGSDDSSGGDVDQMQSDLEEIAVLREQDLRELVRVTDMQVNGHFWRGCSFQYTLSDGRTRTIGEPDPDRAKLGASKDIEADLAEIAALREQGLRTVVTAVDTEVEGQTHRTLICQYVLAGGREITMGETDTELPLPTVMLTPEQNAELTRLLRLDQGEYLGRQEKVVHGRVFAFETYRATLSDGAEVTRAEGQPIVGKTRLTEADWKELRDLAMADAGEDLGTYEEVVRGKAFIFARKRYILSDGTEVIRADGTARND